MEQRAYQVALREGKISERESERVSMTELFDMVAGSETGAIIATNLVLPNDDADTKAEQKNKYFADHSVAFFKENADVYRDKQVPWWMKLIFWAAAVLFIVCLAYGLHVKCARREQFHAVAENLRLVIQGKKGKSLKDCDLSLARSEL